MSTPSWQDVLDLVTRLDASGLADAEVVMPGVSVRVSRTALDVAPAAAPVAAAPVAAAPVAAAPVAAAPVAAAPVAAQPVPAPAAVATGPEITAPMLGVLYHRPAPDAPPFVQVGDTVTPETTVAIIEVMKLMNPVHAGVSGVIAEVCVADATTVEHGDVLFRLQG